MRLNRIHIMILCLLSLAAFQFCNSTKDKTKSIENNLSDSSKGLVLKINNSLFSIPSPHQAALLIDELGINYNAEFINPIEKASKYEGTFDVALNLGVYGTDLGYLNIYGQLQNSIKYFHNIKNIADELGILSSYDKEMLAHIEDNFENRDSIMFYLSKIYRESDILLERDNRAHISALVIAGGWIESLYILTQCYKLHQNNDLRNRIGEQKHTLHNLVELLSPYYYESENYSHLINQLVELSEIFDNVIFSYAYDDLDTDTSNNITTIKSESRIIISQYHLETITNKLASIRNGIVN